MHTACVWSEKLPFAGYSVVKDHSGGNIAPRNLSVIAGRFPPDPHRSLTRGAPMPHSVRSRQSLGLRPEPRLGRSRGPFAPLRSLAARSLAFARYVATARALRSQKAFQRPSEPAWRAGVSSSRRAASASGRRQLNYQARSGGLRGPREGRVGLRPTPTKLSGPERGSQ